MKKWRTTNYDKKEHDFEMDIYFLEQKVCIICKDRAHRISFDKDCKIKTYSYYT